MPGDAVPAWDPAGLYRFERSSSKGPVKGTLRGDRISLAGADPRGQLEIMWLQRDGRDLAGSTWRQTGDFRATRAD